MINPTIEALSKEETDQPRSPTMAVDLSVLG